MKNEEWILRMARGYYVPKTLSSYIFRVTNDREKLIFKGLSPKIFPHKNEPQTIHNHDQKKKMFFRIFRLLFPINLKKLS